MYTTRSAMTIDPSAPTVRLVHSASAAKWLVKGRLLLVRNRVLNVARDCQIVFSPERSPWLDTEDKVEAVEFWFRYPIADGILYLPDVQTQLLQPVTDSAAVLKVSNSHKQWLLRYTGRTARAIRRLYEQL